MTYQNQTLHDPRHVANPHFQTLTCPCALPQSDPKGESRKQELQDFKIERSEDQTEEEKREYVRKIKTLVRASFCKEKVKIKKKSNRIHFTL